ncbi:M36 family metallopeptidase [Paenibacillus sp. OSY-SE]|uniref:M36 family metallopeptidase n=1 Tax=Paenibacillus sp. OSY-SE TaxID=1196323 RepID=UPI0002E0D345|nr:M36 family metallopeptidase [Paenibacillus sp. OSY-SE]
MIREVDKRNYSYNNNDNERVRLINGFAEAISENIPDTTSINISNINPITGSPAMVTINNNEESDGRSFITRAIDYMQHTSAVLSFSPETGVATEAEFVPDPNVITTSAGVSIVHLHQHYRGIPIFQMSRTVRFSGNGTVEDIVGDNVIFNEEINVMPEIDVNSAIKKANEYMNLHHQVDEDAKDGWGQPIHHTDLNTSSYEPKILVTFPTVARYTVLDQGEFGDYIPANLVIFHQNPNSRLAWRFIISLKEMVAQYEVIVAADNEQPGEILYFKQISRHIKAKGNIYETNPGDGRTMVPFPRPLMDYPVKPVTELPSDFPKDWVNETETIGNSTEAVFCDSNSSTLQVCSPATHLNGNVVNGMVTFDPSDATGNDQKILNIFYFCNYMHDFFYMLGFDEKAGNFQKINSSGIGNAGDSVRARAYSGPVFGTANMSTPVDGQSPIMRMGIVASNNRHTAFDADVVFHEFTHGVTNRLAGGPLDFGSLEQPQCNGMGEGWSDYFALTIQNYSRNVEKVVTGAWVSGNPNGIRHFKYDDNFPDHFGKLGTGRYREGNEHEIGEIWCAILMYMNRRFVEKFSKDKGYNLAWRIVVDGLKRSRSNPSFLDARSDILKALEDLKNAGKISAEDYSAARHSAWKTFSKFGMGPNARSAGASLVGIVADFELPEDLH